MSHLSAVGAKILHFSVKKLTLQIIQGFILSLVSGAQGGLDLDPLPCLRPHRSNVT